MIYEHYVKLAGSTLPERLHDGLERIRSTDHCTVAFAQSPTAKEQSRIRERYTKGSNDRDGTTEPVEQLDLPDALALGKDPSVVSKRWMSIVVDFTLLTPWYSKDDRPFHVLDNPVRKDRVFGVPFMAAASWKGLLRWACRMEAGLLEHLEKHGARMKGWNEPDWIVHLFGNERGAGEEFSRGALQIFPTWFDRIGFEVINPHSREKRAGTQPIVYEVVPAGTRGKLTLLYAPSPGNHAPPETMPKLVQAIEDLLTVYGFSAKRTAGWGLAAIKKCELSLVKGSDLDRRLPATEGKNYTSPDDQFIELMDESGHPIDVLLGTDMRIISKTQFKKLGSDKPSRTNQQFDQFRRWYEEYGEEHQRRIQGDNEREHRVVVKRTFGSLEDLIANLREGETPQSGDER